MSGSKTAQRHFRRELRDGQVVALGLVATVARGCATDGLEVQRYHQNPIQIYFCEDANGEFNVGVCEVTNTPWNHHVFFVFRLEGDERPKPCHGHR
eukprot:Skav209247  [mRNA]  locus=scaffold990:38466:42128:- [translate_table: standard]